MRSKTLCLLPLAVALLIAGCDRDAPTNQAGPVPSPSAPAETSPGPEPTPTAPPRSEPAPAAAGGIPQAFLGSWDRDSAACRDRMSELRLVITSDRLRFYETVADVVSVTPIERGVRVTARASGEGISFDAEYRLRRNADDSLDLASDGATVRRVRCT